MKQTSVITDGRDDMGWSSDLPTLDCNVKILRDRRRLDIWSRGNLPFLSLRGKQTTILSEAISRTRKKIYEPSMNKMEW